MKLKDFDFRIWHNGQKYAGDVVKKYMGLSGFSDDVEVELWSGFCDSKGTKIYEGDIVSHYDKDGDICFHSKAVFDSGEFKLLAIEVPTIIEFSHIDKHILQATELEVIGNIHENENFIREKTLYLKQICF